MSVSKLDGQTFEWTSSHDRLLKRLFREHGRKWVRIASSMEGATAAFCRQRWIELKKNSKRTYWTPQQVKQLESIVKKPHSWVGVSELIRVHGPKCCYNKWYISSNTPEVAGKWSEYETRRLQVLQRKHNRDWKTIADKLGRSPNGCLKKWVSIQGQRVRPGPWTELELSNLKKLHNHFDNNWTRIAKELPGRYPEECRKKFNNYFVTTNKGKWSDRERGKLIKLYQQLGPKWTEIAEGVKGRNPNQCLQEVRRIQERESSRKERWTTAETRKLTVLHKKHGNNWVKIAKYVDRRTPIQCRDRIKWISAQR